MAEHAARLADAGGLVEGVADGQRMQHGATVSHGMAAGGRQHAGDLGVGHHAVAKFDVGDETLAAETAARERHHHRLKLQAGRALGEIDGLAHHLFGFHQVDHGARLHAVRRDVRKAHDAYAVAAPAQHVARRLRFQPRDHADDLAGADVEGGHRGGTARRHRLHLGREAEAEHGHAASAFAPRGKHGLSLPRPERGRVGERVLQPANDPHPALRADLTLSGGGDKRISGRAFDITPRLPCRASSPSRRP
jgi:hypothetical protein